MERPDFETCVYTRTDHWGKESKTEWTVFASYDGKWEIQIWPDDYDVIWEGTEDETKTLISALEEAIAHCKEHP